MIAFPPTKHRLPLNFAGAYSRTCCLTETTYPGAESDPDLPIHFSTKELCPSNDLFGLLLNHARVLKLLVDLDP